MNRKPKILYLEDDPNLGEITTDMLSRAGFKVQWVTNGEEGLEALNHQIFDIAVADIMMPKLDGYTFIKTLREKGNQMPIILLSARVLTEDVLKGFEIGADDYVRKPFSIEELIARVNRLLKDKSSQANENNFQLGDYKYNHHNYELNYNGESIYLSSRSGQILYQFLTNKDGILSRKEVLLDLWGDDSFFNGRSLDVFISKLRRHLAADSRISIINMRGIGYRLIVV
ncbi:response regulator transcription factor [Flavobacterium sp.]|uniref:response regulator transcription factor n=1 Tax=Flavobacterium sp. TaxID=239 RepID=UPI0025BA94C3|nr:response regulator transcription factor [Flavobacterium sp.]